jgi:nucleotide-binding universal stress UspA family protein
MNRIENLRSATMSGIVVGLDDWGQSRHALGWAMREAAQRHVPLTVVTVHPNPVRPAARIYWAEPDLPGDDVDQELIRKRIKEIVDDAASDLGGPAPEVIVKVVTGDPAAELAAASRDADLLVVGSVNQGFAKLLGGSVSSQVMHHAACPVVVVPGVHPAA